MSWIKDALDYVNNVKDPLIKFIFRLSLLVIFFVIIYLAYALVTGQVIIWNNGNYAIKSNKSDSENNTAMIKSANPETQKSAVLNPIKKNTVTTGDSASSHREVKAEPHSQEAILKRKTTLESIPPNKPIDVSHLTINDKSHIEKMLYHIIDYREKYLQPVPAGSQSLSPIPISVAIIDIYYSFYDTSSELCAAQIRDYLISKGFNVKFSRPYKDKMDAGFVLKYLPVGATIYVGYLPMDGKRSYQMK